MKLAPKLTLALFLGICVVFATNGFLEIRREIALFESVTRREHHLMGQGLSVSLAEVWAVEGESRALDLLRRVNETESGRVQIHWVWTDSPPGQPHHAGLPPDSLVQLERGDEVSVERSGGDTRSIATYIPVTLEGTRRGAIELVESLAEERRYVRGTVFQLIAATVLMALVSGAIALVLGVAFVGKPMRRLVDQARRVGAGHLGDRLSLNQKDEIGSSPGSST
jgi:two-component system, NtrC family, sensor kinase